MSTIETTDAHGRQIAEYQASNGKHYRYRLTNMHASSAQYGVCEVCRTHCSEVFQQTTYQHYSFQHGTRTLEGFAHRANTFGHEQCLRSLRRAPLGEAIAV
jgi:hypothetical protein